MLEFDGLLVEEFVVHFELPRFVLFAFEFEDELFDEFEVVFV
jgi:hypothetical protein